MLRFKTCAIEKCSWTTHRSDSFSSPRNCLGCSSFNLFSSIFLLNCKSYICSWPVLFSFKRWMLYQWSVVRVPFEWVSKSKSQSNHNDQLKQRETMEPVYIRSINDSSTKLYAPENARDQVAFGFSLVFDWLIGWHRFFRLIIEGLK